MHHKYEMDRQKFLTVDSHPLVLWSECTPLALVYTPLHCQSSHAEFSVLVQPVNTRGQHFKLYTCRSCISTKDASDIQASILEVLQL